MARLCADENFPLPVVEGLRRLGHDVITLEEIGKSDQALSDETVLELASSKDRAVVTINKKHFIRLHRDAAGHAGIIVCTYDPYFERQAERIDAAIDPQTPLLNRILRVNRPHFPF